jgi:hypothetical protein
LEQKNVKKDLNLKTGVRFTKTVIVQLGESHPGVQKV